MPDQACPRRLMSIVEGVYWYDCLFCGDPAGVIIASDVREHQLGVDCSNILDPIVLPTSGLPPPDVRPTEDDEATCGCGCAYSGLRRYTPLNAHVHEGPGFTVKAMYTVEYEEQDDEDNSVRRVARLFEFKGDGPWKKKRILVGQEMPPGTSLRRANPLEGELAEAFGHHQCVKTSEGVFHVLTKSYLRPIPTPRIQRPVIRERAVRGIAAVGRRGA